MPCTSSSIAGDAGAGVWDHHQIDDNGYNLRSSPRRRRRLSSSSDEDNQQRRSGAGIRNVAHHHQSPSHRQSITEPESAAARVIASSSSVVDDDSRMMPENSVRTYSIFNCFILLIQQFKIDFLFLLSIMLLIRVAIRPVMKIRNAINNVWR
jgi:hypothetical protein